MNDFMPGQRWVSDSELHMGLGTVLTVDHRSVTIVFLATGETRIYSKQTAPLTRVNFTKGDNVLSHQGWTLKIESFSENDGLITYFGSKEDGTQAQLEEGQLDNFIQLNRPTDRLFTGQIDQDKHFELRYQTLLHINRLAHSDLRGLTGVRTSLIPHQLYIAHEVANRYAPRVLLADEVGLGKTIEAGLILHQQLLTERAKRVLIVVPESLLHQWLVEMMRRFNLHFSIFDEERCQACEPAESADDIPSQIDNEIVNPFHTEQLILCNLEFLVKYPKRFQQALDGSWDLLVVDEAHHLQWSPQQASTEYQVVAKLSEQTKGVLLLTATPEQLGKTSHFARLRLLDPDRFPNFDAFAEEEKSYEPIAQAVEELLSERTLSANSYQTLLGTVKEGDNQGLLDTLQNKTSHDSDKSTARNDLIEHLLDRHGTGRVLFRNTRAAVKGFPDRTVTPYPLALPPEYAQSLENAQISGSTQPQLLLCPEILYESTAAHKQKPWIHFDPRVNWLSEKLKELKSEKVLVIAAHAQTVLDLAEALRTKGGIHAAVFHEGLSIVERDRAAAFFADIEYGSQVLLCSEIGSEGRNFQFSHHMILFDLPLNPDLLEQRIGRLDRIGQTDTIRIHVPYLENSAQALMVQWYHQGLSAFEHTCPAGHNVFVQVEATLLDAIHQIDEGLDDLPALIETTKQLHRELNEALQRGRDRLLEYNSCRPNTAAELKKRAAQQDAESNLQIYMESIFDCYGVDIEEDTENSYILRPSDHMQTHSFPELKVDGMTISYDRNTALANEDMHYLTWDHPMVSGAMDMVFTSELGNTAVTALKHEKLNPGTLLLECIYLLESASSSALQTSRYLPPTTIRIVIDHQGNNHDKSLPHELIARRGNAIDAETGRKIVRTQAKEIKSLMSAADQLAQQKAPDILAQAHYQTTETLSKEINRLKALRQFNPNVRDEEISFFDTQLEELTRALDSATPRLDALRVVVAF